MVLNSNQTIKTIAEGAKDAYKGFTKYGGKAVKNVKDQWGGNSQGGINYVKRMLNGESKGALGAAFGKNGQDFSDGTNWGAVAGSYIGVAAGYRALSGGGLYKDKNGNTDLMGIPFV